MEIKEQSGLRAVLKDISIPPMYVVQQNFPQDGIPDVSACLRESWIGRSSAPEFVPACALC